MCKFLSCFFYKSKLSFCNNLLSYIGLFLIYFFISLIKKLIRVNEGNVIAFCTILTIFITIFLIAFAIIVWTIEYTFDLKIKNKFILENKIYNIFFIIGFSIMLLYLSTFTITIFYVLFKLLFIK